MWNIVQCAVQGRSHLKTQVPCQDKTYSMNCNGVQVIALADGAGSARLSHYGAETVTQYICQELVEKFDTYYTNEDGIGVKQQIMNGIVSCLTKKSEDLNCELKDLASTLLLVAVNEEHYIIAHIGDGVIGYLKDDQLKIASKPENGEFANTTTFTTSKDSIMTMKLLKGKLGSIQGFVLMSDGTEASLYHKKERRLAEVIKKVMRLSVMIPTRKVEDLLQESFDQVICKATTDDCSIAIMVNEHGDNSGYKSFSIAEKCELLQINASASSTRKQVERYEEILHYMQEERTLDQVARYVRIKPKYVRKYMSKLISLNFVEKNNSMYRTLLKMR